eukprot:scaffold62029_cov65-Attheya_sp.AAC.5
MMCFIQGAQWILATFSEHDLHFWPQGMIAADGGKNSVVEGGCHWRADSRYWVNAAADRPGGCSDGVSGTGCTQWVGSLLTKGMCELTVACGSGDKVACVAGGTVNRGHVSVAGGRETVPGWQDFCGMFDRGRVSGERQVVGVYMGFGQIIRVGNMTYQAENLCKPGSGSGVHSQWTMDMVALALALAVAVPEVG